MTLGASPARDRENVSEIQIEGKHNSGLRHGFRRDLGVGKTNETFIAKVDRVVICASQSFHGRERHAHIGQESHAAGLLKKPISSFASAEAYCRA